LASGQSLPAPTKAELVAQAALLDGKHDLETRLNAVRWFNANAGHEFAELAIPSLEKCVRRDPDGKIRSQAVLSLCLTLKRANKPCCLAVMEAILDGEDEVRWQVMACLPIFKSIAPGAVKVLLPGLESARPEVRGDVLLALGYAAGKDEEALAAIDAAKTDPVFHVRASAHLASFRARDRLIEHLPYLIMLRENPEALLSPGADAERRQQEWEYRNLLVLGIGGQLGDWSESRCDELADALMTLSADESPVVRRGAANLLRQALTKVKTPPKRDPLEPGPHLEDGTTNNVFQLLVPVAGDREQPNPPERPQKSSVALRLDKLGAKAMLLKLRDGDSDPSVRKAAQSALQRWSSLDSPER
jgi:hypothetical protein